MERLFRQKISRAQQDAHEFLQVVAETLAEEYHRRRKEETKSDGDEEQDSTVGDECTTIGATATAEALPNSSVIMLSVNGQGNCLEETGRMPLEGTLKSEIECLKCQFKPKPTISSFVVLTLPVPQKVSKTIISSYR